MRKFQVSQSPLLVSATFVWNKWEQASSVGKHQTKLKSNWQVLISVLSTKLWEEVFNPFLFQMNSVKGSQGASVLLTSTSQAGCRAHWKFLHLNLQRVHVFISTGPHFSQTNRSFLSSWYSFLLKTKAQTQSFCMIWERSAACLADF